MRALSITALTLMVIGAVNWLLVGLFDFNIVSYLFGEMSTISRIVYTLVGLAGLYGISMLITLSESRDVCVPGHGRTAESHTR